MTQLVKKTGVVKAIQGSMAIAVTMRESSCEHCKARGSCEAMGGTGANAEVRALNTAEARVGDIVTISMRSISLLKASFVIYMVPILALLGGMISGFLLAKILPLGEELVVGTLSGLALVGSFVWLRKKGKALAERAEFIPEITARKSPPKTIEQYGEGCSP
jgi:sigma-E factor negative regulatory protein RseC